MDEDECLIISSGVTLRLLSGIVEPRRSMKLERKQHSRIISSFSHSLFDVTVLVSDLNRLTLVTLCLFLYLHVACQTVYINARLYLLPSGCPRRACVDDTSSGQLARFQQLLAF